MQSPPTSSTPQYAHGYTLNFARLDALRDASGIESDADLSDVMGVDKSTLHRVRHGTVRVSAEFMSRVCFAFPNVEPGYLFVNTRTLITN
jgi:transcriptional regulator with XRE-family HTH domain